MSKWIGLEILILKQPWKSRIGPMEQIWGRNCNQIFSGAPYLVQKDQGHLVTSVFLPQGHRTRYKIIRGILDPDHPPKFWQWPWDTGHWVFCVFFSQVKLIWTKVNFHTRKLPNWMQDARHYSYICWKFQIHLAKIGPTNEYNIKTRKENLLFNFSMLLPAFQS